jgi:hypothetical protein
MKSVDEPAKANPPAGLANMQGYENEVLASQPRPLVAKEEVSQEPIKTPAPVQSTERRQVSSNACEPCRKRKSKGMITFTVTVELLLTCPSAMA